MPPWNGLPTASAALKFADKVIYTFLSRAPDYLQNSSLGFKLLFYQFFIVQFGDPRFVLSPGRIPGPDRALPTPAELHPPTHVGDCYSLLKKHAFVSIIEFLEFFLQWLPKNRLTMVRPHLPRPCNRADLGADLPLSSTQMSQGFVQRFPTRRSTTSSAFPLNLD